MNNVTCYSSSLSTELTKERYYRCHLHGSYFIFATRPYKQISFQRKKHDSSYDTKTILYL